MEQWRTAVTRIETGKASANDLEDGRLEFKTEKPSLKETLADLTDAVVCFANASGGVLVVGVQDRGTGSAAVPGTNLDPDVVRSAVYERSEPPLMVNVSPVFTQGDRPLLVIEVPVGVAVHSTKKGYAPRRVGHQCLPLRPIEIARLEEERSGRDWSAETSTRSVDEADPEAVAVLVGLLRASPTVTAQALARLSLRELVVELGLSEDGQRFNKAGDLLLCPPMKGHPADLLVYQYRQTRSGEATHVRRWQQPLLTAHREGLAAIEGRLNSLPMTTRAGQQIVLEDYPMVAIREALTNALVHGDLRDGRPVQVEHSPEALVITSPGALVSGINQDNFLTHGSKPRFLRLARALTSLALVEGAGQGFDRMFREMVRNGRRVPRVDERVGETAQTSVSFEGGPADTRLAKFVTELPEAEQSDTDALLITHMLCTRRTVNARVVSPIIQRPVEQAQQVLHRLTHGEGAPLEATPGTAGRAFPNYRLRAHALVTLGPSVKYNRRSTEDVDRKVIDHVREYETINSRTVPRLFDIDVYAARDMLKDLVGREVLVRVSQQTRGTAVKYGPGPEFPVKKTSKRRRAASLADELPLDEGGAE